jgi:hypothetical protein
VLNRWQMVASRAVFACARKLGRRR